MVLKLKKKIYNANQPNPSVWTDSKENVCQVKQNRFWDQMQIPNKLFQNQEFTLKSTSNLIRHKNNAL